MDNQFLLNEVDTDHPEPSCTNGNVDKHWVEIINEIGLPVGFSSKHILLSKATDGVRSVRGYIPVYSSPRLPINDCIVVPMYPNYKARADGFILNSKNEVLKSFERDGYLYVKVTNGIGKVVNERVNRLVAMAWIINRDHFNKPIVNHKDGNKLNNACYNLEWCSYSENNEHAFNLGLRTDNTFCKVRDFESGAVTHFKSKTDAAKFMGIETASLNNFVVSKREGFLFSNRYEFKLEGDTTPWFYNDGVDPVHLSRYVIIVKYKDDDNSLIFRGNTEFRKHFDIRVTNKSVPDMVDMVRKLPGVESVEYIDQTPPAKIEVFRISDKVTRVFDSIRETSRELNIPFSNIQNRISAKSNIPLKGYLFRVFAEDYWDKSIKEFKTGKWCIISRDKEGNVLHEGSLRSTAELLKVDRDVIKLRLERNTDLKGVTFEKVRK